MHSSRMFTVRNSSCLPAGGSPPHPSGSRYPPKEQALPWRPAARHAGIPPAGHAGIPPGDLLQGMLGYHPPPVDRHTPVKT